MNKLNRLIALGVAVISLGILTATSAVAQEKKPAMSEKMPMHKMGKMNKMGKMGKMGKMNKMGKMGKMGSTQKMEKMKGKMDDKMKGKM